MEESNDDNSDYYVSRQSTMITQNTILNVTLRYVHHRLTRAHTMCSSYYNDVQVDGVEIEQTTFAARRKHKNVRACVCCF